MSALTARRLKEGSAVAGPKPAVTLKPSKPLTPTISDKRSSSVGKENPPGPTLRSSAQKPTMRPVPRVDKAARNGGDAGARWSMPSAPRGRSSSPSEFLRVSSYAPKNRRVSVDRVERGPSPGSVGERDRSVSSAGRSSSRVRGSISDKQGKGIRDLDVKVNQVGLNGVRVLRDSKNDGKIGVNSARKNGICGELQVKSVEIENNSNGIKSRVLGTCDGGVNLRSASKNPDGVGGRTSERCNSGKSKLTSDIKDQSADRVDDKVVKIGNRAVLGLKESNEKCLSNGKVSEGSKEEGSNGGCVGIKHPSKLHEKLAFLEGKVKRIASDIKKTKEILDMNNPDASKVILSDIQEKISGIEKAMVHVSNGSGGKMLKGNEQGPPDAKVVEKGHIEEVSNVKSSVKGLNSEDLEARLFPHHKLIRNRTALKASESSQSQVVETSCDSKVDEKTVSPIDENHIAIEFLASLDNEQTKVTTDGHEDLENCEVQEMDGVTTGGVEKSSKMVTGKQNDELILTTDETLDESGDQENRQAIIDEETEDTSIYQLNGIGQKTSTGGWFMSEGESVLLAHDDGSCTFYDIVNSEVFKCLLFIVVASLCTYAL